MASRRIHDLFLVCGYGVRLHTPYKEYLEKMFELRLTIPKDNHELFLYSATVECFRDVGLKDVGETGEITMVVKMVEIPTSSKFHPAHLQYLRDAMIIP